MENEVDFKLNGLLELIQHTDYVATRIRGKLSQSEILKMVVDEFKPLVNQRLLILMLSEDRKHFMVAGHTFPENQTVLVEKLLGKKAEELLVPYAKLSALFPTVEEGQT